jgi:non-specific serine/threonine protein kinase/serine/threonine-protein kinase
MEYIPGARPITLYAQERHLGVRERLKLLAEVCEAVHHGHQRGVVHRDLKPSNILVDSGGSVKLIDFGVARAVDADFSLTTAQTGVGQLVGTLQYMSPEQCAADSGDIDTRSDVYAIGVVMYEVLAGKLPYDLSGVPVFEAPRIIREQPPERPSSVDPALKGDLSLVMLKALEKDRSRRYQSAAELGQDIRRFLTGEGITARPPSVAYQARVFARRHRSLGGECGGRSWRL